MAPWACTHAAQGYIVEWSRDTLWHMEWHMKVGMKKMHTVAQVWHRMLSCQDRWGGTGIQMADMVCRRHKQLYGLVTANMSPSGQGIEMPAEDVQGVKEEAVREEEET